MILTQPRDLRLITIRRGGTLTDENHRLLCTWTIACAERVLPYFEATAPDDDRARNALNHAKAWVRGEIGMKASRTSAYYANQAARPLIGAPRFASYAAAQAACVPHVAAHELGAAAYAIKAAMASVEPELRDRIRASENRWGLITGQYVPAIRRARGYALSRPPKKVCDFKPCGF